MSRLRLIVALLLSALALLTAAPAWANYRFSVPEMRMTSTIRPDASVEIEYEIRFENSGQAIDVVDIGLPHEGYNLRNMIASIDDKPLTDIRTSSYIPIGVEVNLRQHAIPTGQSATFRFSAVMPDMVFNDTTRDDFASFRITPTWFDDNLLMGSTDLQIAVRLPPGVQPDQVLHQGKAFTNKAVFADSSLVGWRIENARLSGPHMVGLSFPRASMSRVVVVTRLELLARWFEKSPEVRLISGLLLAAMFGIFFFRYSGGTGWSLFFFLFAGWALLYAYHPRLQLWTMPLWLAVCALMEWRLRRKRSVYLPPLVHVEGGGIKRGLTAPEAAVLLELPLGKVVTLVIFGMLKKGLLVQLAAEPLRVGVAPAFQGMRRPARRKAAAKLGTVIHTYEHEFMDAVDGVSDVEDTDFSDALNTLVTHVSDRVMAFDVEETKAYYRSIVARAWTQAKAIGEVELRTKEVDKNLEWMLIDDGWSSSFTTWDQSGYRYRPSWVRSATPSSGGVAAGLPDVGGGKHSAPSLGDVTASFAGWAENVTGKLASTISPSQLKAAAGESGGAINLSGADKVTGDVLAAFFSGSGSSGGGGGGGGSSCACAGCACACACAGGGR